MEQNNDQQRVLKSSVNITFGLLTHTHTQTQIYKHTAVKRPNTRRGRREEQCVCVCVWLTSVASRNRTLRLRSHPLQHSLKPPEQDHWQQTELLTWSKNAVWTMWPGQLLHLRIPESTFPDAPFLVVMPPLIQLHTFQIDSFFPLIYRFFLMKIHTFDFSIFLGNESDDNDSGCHRRKCVKSAQYCGWKGPKCNGNN